MLTSFLFKRLAVIKRNNESGFSLTELMITILILGILLAIAIPVYSNQTEVALRAQVDTDIVSTASALSQWQNTRSEERPIPTAAEWENIKVVSDPEINIIIKHEDWGDAQNRRFCLEATRTISDEVYHIHYSLVTKEKGEGVCPPFVAPEPENYN